MTIAKPAPLPWDWVTNSDGTGHVYLIDATGRKIGVIWGKPDEKVATADLILECCNERSVAK